MSFSFGFGSWFLVLGLEFEFGFGFEKHGFGDLEFVMELKCECEWEEAVDDAVLDLFFLTDCADCLPTFEFQLLDRPRRPSFCNTWPL